MECVACRMMKIGPKIPPFGGHLCGKGHLQCDECNTFKNGLCRICEGLNTFIHMCMGNNFGNENTPDTFRAAESSDDGITNCHLEKKDFCKPASSFKDKAVQCTQQSIESEAEQGIDEATCNEIEFECEEDAEEIEDLSEFGCEEDVGEIEDLSEFEWEEDAEEIEDLSDVCSITSNETMKSFSSGSSSHTLVNCDEDILAQQMDDLHMYKNGHSCATCGEPQSRSQIQVQDLPQATLVEPLKGTLLMQQSIDVERKSSTDVKPCLASTHNMQPFDMRPTPCEKIMTKLSNVHRVCLDPQSQGLHTSAAQIETVPCHADLVTELLQTKQHYINMPPMTASSLQISRAPITCPVSSCQRLTFVSDFVKHMEVDHSKVPINYIMPGVYKNIAFNPKLSNVGASECQMVCLVKNKVTNLGIGKFKNFLPIAVMSARISVENFLNALEDTPATSTEHVAADEDVLVIWLTGIVPEEFPISIALTASSNAGADPPMKKMSSFDVLSIRESQSVFDIVKTDNNLSIYPGELQALTNDGTEKLGLQIVVY